MQEVKNSVCDTEAYRAGFVSVVGAPNVGKSTLVNALVGDRLCMVTNKIQTTRSEVMGIFTTTSFQLVFSDTPGWLVPRYALQTRMLKTVKKALNGTDAILVLTDVSSLNRKIDEITEDMAHILRTAKSPVFHVVNKIDTLDDHSPTDRQSILQAHVQQWSQYLPNVPRLNLSARRGENLDGLLSALLPHIPIHPAYFPVGQRSNRDDRFFITEHVVKAVFLNFRKEIPYSVCAEVTTFEESDAQLRVAVNLYTERESQKKILLGKGGSAIKRIRLRATKDLQNFFNKAVRLQLQVVVLKDWRKDSVKLKALGFFS